MGAPAAEQLTELLRQSLADGKSAFLTVSSGSMAPLLQVGDQIEVVATPLSELTAGDIILLAAPAALFSHRLWGVRADGGDNWLVTRGDRLLSFDTPWKSERLLGKIIGWRRQSRYYDLSGPAGQQLNQAITRLAAAELQLFARLYRRPELAALPMATSQPLNFTQFRRARLLTFLLRQLFKARANLTIRRQLAGLRD